MIRLEYKCVLPMGISPYTKQPILCQSPNRDFRPIDKNVNLCTFCKYFVPTITQIKELSAFQISIRNKVVCTLIKSEQCK